MRRRIVTSVIGVVIGLFVLSGAILAALGGFIWPSMGRTTETGLIPRGTAVIKLASQFIDADPDHVLVLLQNSTELRPTGGFITAFAEVTINRGDVQSVSLRASDALDALEYTRVPMPTGLAGNIGTDYLTIKDANWDPNFSTSAANVSRLYQEATGFEADLVLAITTDANEALLKEIGPITFSVNDHAFTVNANSVTETLELYTDVYFADLGLNKENRKQILESYAHALTPALNAYVKSQPFAAWNTLQNLAQTYDIQMWSPKSDTQWAIDALELNRSVMVSESDALLIVDANIGAYKTDPYITRDASYRVDFSDVPTATLTLTYTNTSEPGQLLVKDYSSYTRIYVPAGSTLVSSNGTHVDTIVRHGRTVFGFMLHVPQQQSQTITLTYRLGTSVQDEQSYFLRVERQSGAEINLDVTLDGVSGSKRIQTTTAKDAIIR